MTNHLSDRLAAELAVCEGITEGPWELEPDRTMRDGVYPAYVFAEHMAGYPICDVTSTRIPAGDEDAEFIATARTGYHLALRALQAVMELHSQTFDTPWRRAHPGQPGCSECVDQLDGPAPWPCPTIQAIWEAYENE